MNCLLSSSISAFWPPRTFWSQIVSVTLPAPATSRVATAVRAGGGLFFFAAVSFLSPPGHARQPATIVARTTLAIAKALRYLTDPPSSLPTAAALATEARVQHPPPRVLSTSPPPQPRWRP